MPRYSKTKFNAKARKLLLEGAREVNDAVSTTLGARGRNVVIQKRARTRVLHDGHLVAEEINPRNKFKSAGAEIIKQAEQQQVSTIGDGTTLVIILAYAIASESLKIVESGINPMALKAGLERGKDLLVKRIKELSTEVKTKEQKIQVATISSEDEQMGRLIGETYQKAGVDAVLTAEEIMGSDTFVDHQEGMQIDSGWKHELFITNPKNMTATVAKANILVTDYNLSDPFELIPLFEKLVKSQKMNLVVIAEDIEGNALATLLKNKIEGKMQFLAIKAPSFQMENVLQDIAIVTGAKFISSKAKYNLKELTPDDLGYAGKVTSTKEATVIIDGNGDKGKIKERITSLRDQLKEEKNEFNQEKLKERLAKLTGGVYVLKIGGHTEIEAEERRERAEDAILSTRSAIREGIVPGGEVVLLEALKVLKPENENEDYAFRILKGALQKPFIKLVENAGISGGEMIERLRKEPFGMGIDVTDGKVKDMMKEGIVDASEIHQEAIKNAISVSTALISSDAIVAEYEDDKK